MEDHCSPLSWAYYYHDEGIEELRHYLLHITELEAVILSAKEEITRREFEMVHLKDVLSKTIKERNEAQVECQKLMLEKLERQQQQQQQQLLLLKNEQKPQTLQSHRQQQQLQEEIQFLKQEAPPPLSTGTSSSEDGGDSTNYITIVDPIPHQQQPLVHSPLPEVILKLAADKPLPEKGKLLLAVKDAGPLLQTLLLAGPLPQWQHPPPQLDSIDIPPVTISSPTARLFHQDSFNSFNTTSLIKKRGPDLCGGPDSSSSPTNKHQKIAHH